MTTHLEVLLGVLLIAASVQSRAKYPTRYKDIENNREPYNPCNGARQCYSRTDIVLSILKKTALGVDPFKLDAMNTVDSGVREAIFIPTVHVDSDNVVLNDYVEVPREDVRCHGDIETKLLNLNDLEFFKEYLKFQVPSVDVDAYAHAYEFTASLKFHPTVHDCINGTNSHRDKIFLFRSKTKGSAILKKTSCLTHITSINSSTQPIFTRKFQRALHSLNAAAKDPLSEASREIFRDFVETFGTHYQSSTHFGSAITYEKFYSTQPIDRDESTRRLRCASLEMKSAASLHSPLHDSYSAYNTVQDDLEQCKALEFNQEAFENLDLYSSRIISSGPTQLNTNSLSDVMKVSPTAIHYKLKTISSLFKEKWFDSFIEIIPEYYEESWNSTAMYDFFTYALAHYCEIIMGAPCELLSNDCGYSLREIAQKTNTSFKLCDGSVSCDKGLVCIEESDGEFSCEKPCDIENFCGVDYTCHEEPHSCKGYICVYNGPGKALVVGGYGPQGLLKDVESIPAGLVNATLPEGVGWNTLAIADDYFYTCGGDASSGYVTGDCFRLLRAVRNGDNVTENSSSIETNGNATEHNGSSRTERNTGDYGNDSVNFINNGTWERIHPLPRAADDHTSVTIAENRIWYIDIDRIHSFDVNTGEYISAWLPFRARSSRHCAVSNGNHTYVIGVGQNNDEIWINTESQDELSWHKVANLKRGRSLHACLWYDSNIMITGGCCTRDDVEVFNTETNTVRDSIPMLEGRRIHRMMLYDGYPTVVGGYDGSNYLSDLESFDMRLGRWFTQDVKLQRAKSLFGLVEIEPRNGLIGPGQC